MSNRVAASLVRALHPLLEAVLVARTNAEYELLADQLASCDAQRVRLRRLLCALRERAPLFDTELWCVARACVARARRRELTSEALLRCRTGNWLRGVSMAADLERRRPTGWRSSAHVVVRDERAAGARLAHTLAAEWHATLRAGPASGWLRSCAVLDRVLDAVSADLARLG
jgi:hypothetical protein